MNTSIVHGLTFAALLCIFVLAIRFKMATPIQITPVLRGRASKRFNALLEAQRNDKVTPEEKEKMISLVEKVLSKNK